MIDPADLSRDVVHFRPLLSMIARASPPFAEATCQSGQNRPSIQSGGIFSKLDDKKQTFG
jgi:hypothetical protein